MSMSIPRSLVAARYIWFAGSGLTVLGGVLAVTSEPGVLSWALLGMSAVQAAVAVFAAVALGRGRNWARVTLLVLACLCIGSLYQALQMEAWPSLALNVALASTVGMLANPEAKQFCKREADLQPVDGA